MTDISLDKLLEHFDKRFDSLQNDVNGIRQDFNTFEAGRLTDLTAKVAVLEVQLKNEKKKSEDSVLKKLGYKVIEYIILAIVAGLMFLIIK